MIPLLTLRSEGMTTLRYNLLTTAQGRDDLPADCFARTIFEAVDSDVDDAEEAVIKGTLASMYGGMS